MNKPTLVLRDPELIKQMIVKDFDHFTDHTTMIHEDVEPLWSRNLFSLKGKTDRRDKIEKPLCFSFLLTI